MSDGENAIDLLCVGGDIAEERSWLIGRAAAAHLLLEIYGFVSQSAGPAAD